MKIRLLYDLLSIFTTIYKEPSSICFDPPCITSQPITEELLKLNNVSIKPIFINENSDSNNSYYYQLSESGLYAFSVDGDNVSDKFIYNLNTISPYRYFIKESTNSLCRNLFIRKQFIAGSAPNTYNTELQKSYIHNILACTLNAIELSYSQLDAKHKNIFASVITGGIVRLVDIPLTPLYFGDIIGTNEVVAEAVLQKYNPRDEKFIGLPWIL